MDENEIISLSNNIPLFLYKKGSIHTMDFKLLSSNLFWCLLQILRNPVFLFYEQFSST